MRGLVALCTLEAASGSKRAGGRTELRKSDAKIKNSKFKFGTTTAFALQSSQQSSLAVSLQKMLLQGPTATIGVCKDAAVVVWLS